MVQGEMSVQAGRNMRCTWLKIKHFTEQMMTLQSEICLSHPQGQNRQKTQTVIMPMTIE